MNKKLFVILAVIGIFLTACANFIPVFAAEQKKTAISLKIEYGKKDRSARDYDIIASPAIVTVGGAMATVKIGEENSLGSCKIEITPSTSEKPDLVIMMVKAWELREVRDTDGKYVKKFVAIMDEQAMKVKSGSKTITEISVGADRDLLITITPTIQGN
jgi:hypothetical protein